MKNNKLNFLIAAGLILMAASARIINHEMHLYNLAPVAALGLFSGAVIKDKRYAFVFAILAQFIGDVYIGLFTPWQGFYGIEQVLVYAALILVTVLGSRMGKPSALKVFGYTIAGSTIFFLISNFGIWLSIQLGGIDILHYGKGFTGLMNTYIAAIPFFRNTLLGDMAGAVLLFGAYALLQKALSGKMQKAEA